LQLPQLGGFLSPFIYLPIPGWIVTLAGIVNYLLLFFSINFISAQGHGIILSTALAAKDQASRFKDLKDFFLKVREYWRLLETGLSRKSSANQV